MTDAREEARGIVASHEDAFYDDPKRLNWRKLEDAIADALDRVRGEQDETCETVEHGAHSLCEHVRQWWEADKERIATLEAELERVRGQLTTAIECNRDLAGKLTDTMTRIATLTAALRRYGMHEDTCKSMDDVGCTCGLAEALGAEGGP